MQLIDALGVTRVRWIAARREKSRSWRGRHGFVCSGLGLFSRLCGKNLQRCVGEGREGLGLRERAVGSRLAGREAAPETWKKEGKGDAGTSGQSEKRISCLAVRPQNSQERFVSFRVPRAESHDDRTRRRSRRLHRSRAAAVVAGPGEETPWSISGSPLASDASGSIEIITRCEATTVS